MKGRQFCVYFAQSVSSYNAFHNNHLSVLPWSLGQKYSFLISAPFGVYNLSNRSAPKAFLWYIISTATLAGTCTHLYPWVMRSTYSVASCSRRVTTGIQTQTPMTQQPEHEFDALNHSAMAPYKSRSRLSFSFPSASIIPQAGQADHFSFSVLPLWTSL